MIKSERLLSLDVMRGVTIAAMILVNNPVSGSMAYAPLCHADWHGLTPTDLIYPFFIFIMGVSACFSLERMGTTGLTGASFAKVVKRGVLIFAVGFLLKFTTMFISGTIGYAIGNNTEQLPYLAFVFPLDNMRILGVLQGLAIAYLFGALLVLALRFKHILLCASAILVAYLAMLHLGNGYVFGEDNIVVIIDRAILGVNHLPVESIGKVKMAFEPESLLSSLPRIAQFMMGVYVGRIITSCNDNTQRINTIFIFATIVLFAGFLLQYGDPLNKKLWTSSFTLVTTGLGALMLSLLIWIIDIKRYRRWSTPFESFGVNPLFLYCLSIILASVCRLSVTIGGEATTFKKYFFKTCIAPFADGSLGSLIYSLLFVSVIWCIGYVLYRKRIYIKL